MKNTKKKSENILTSFIFAQITHTIYLRTCFVKIKNIYIYCIYKNRLELAVNLFLFLLFYVDLF